MLVTELELGSDLRTGILLVRELGLGLERESDSLSVHLMGIKWVRELELGLESELDSKWVHLTGTMLVTELELG